MLRTVALVHLSNQVRLDYLEVCHPQTLEPLEGDLRDYGTVVIAIACYLGDVRLIDNIVLGD